MSLLNLLNIGKSAFFANQAALNVTGHNIANVNTQGYTRQSVILEIATPAANSAGREPCGRTGVDVFDGLSPITAAETLSTPAGISGGSSPRADVSAPEPRPGVGGGVNARPRGAGRSAGSTIAWPGSGVGGRAGASVRDSSGAA